MTRARLVLSFATLLAFAPFATAEEPRPPTPPAPPAAPADAKAREEALARARANLAELKAMIDEARAARDAAKAAGEGRKVRVLEARVGELEGKILGVKRDLHALEGGRPEDGGIEQERVARAFAEIRTALERARKERGEADARGDAQGAAAARAKVAELERRLVDLKTRHPDLVAKVAGRAVTPPGQPVGPARIASDLKQLGVALEQARVARKDADLRGDAAGEAAAKAVIVELERRIADLKARHPDAASGVKGRVVDAKGVAVERVRIVTAHAELGAAMERARAECRAAEARGDAAAAEALRKKIGELERRAADLRRKHPDVEVATPVVREFRADLPPGVHYYKELDFGPDAPGPRLHALKNAARILREAGMPDRAEMLERDAANLTREMAQRREAAPRPGGDQDLREQVAALREEVRRLREAIERMNR